MKHHVIDAEDESSVFGGVYLESACHGTIARVGGRDPVEPYAPLHTVRAFGWIPIEDRCKTCSRSEKARAAIIRAAYDPDVMFSSEEWR